MNAELVHATRVALGLHANPVLTALPMAGSDREYWRVALPAGGQCVACRHQGLRAENLNFAPLARVLGARGIRVPAILAEDEPARLLWLEDLGDDCLEQLLRAPARGPAAARAAMEEIARLHSLAMDKELTALAQPPFDTSLYLWEQGYFFDHLAGRHLQLPAGLVSACRTHPALRELADSLAGLPRVPVHRDFQSQNILLQADGRAALIDFQGLRAGLAEYDLASLFYDPYTQLPAALAGELFTHYHRYRGTDAAASLPLLQACGIQRLMQALGAYGNLGHNLGKPRYLEFIPVAMDRLRQLASGHPVADALAPVLGG